MISTSTDSSGHPEEASATTGLNGSAGAQQVVPGNAGAAGFDPSMTGAEMLALIFQTCDEMGVSDVQMRSNLPVYIETNLGMECLNHLGILSSDDV